MTTKKAHYWQERLPYLIRELESLYSDLELAGVFKEHDLAAVETAINELQWFCGNLDDRIDTMRSWESIPDDSEFE
jgi:hypothetical protein